MIYLLIGESGAGKSAVEKELIKEGFNKIMSVTTRSPRAGEVDGVDYRFLTLGEVYSRILEKDDFVEIDYYNGNLYGTLKEDCKDGYIKAITPAGAEIMRDSGVDTTVIYITTSEDVRAERMYERGNNLNSIDSRLQNDRDMDYSVHDYVIVNEGDIKDTVSKVIDIINN